jgi:hypothetical protein
MDSALPRLRHVNNITYQLLRDEARRIAANKLPEIHRKG